MSAKHTPVWVISRPNGKIQISENGGNQVCLVWKDSRAAERASLIAAAPELLEALEYVESVMDYDGYEDMRGIVRAAIAKAKGE